MVQQRPRKRTVKTAWLCLPLLPVVFLLFLDWDRVQARLKSFRQEPIVFSIPVSGRELPPQNAVLPASQLPPVKIALPAVQAAPSPVSLPEEALAIPSDPLVIPQASPELADMRTPLGSPNAPATNP